MKIGLIGDYDPNVTAHRAIPAAIEIASNDIDISVAIEWLNTPEISKVDLGLFFGFWCVPASPYLHAENVLEAISFARRNKIPFLGTCGGYQHAALEFAKNKLNLAEAGNAEENPETSLPIISALHCRLSDEAGTVFLNQTSKLYEIYGQEVVSEKYNCGYGINRNLLTVFHGSSMHFTAFDEDGDPRALEIDDHPYFIGTAFQPERSAFLGRSHPLIKSFLVAVSKIK